MRFPAEYHSVTFGRFLGNNPSVEEEAITRLANVGDWNEAGWRAILVAMKKGDRRVFADQNQAWVRALAGKKNESWPKEFWDAIPGFLAEKGPFGKPTGLGEMLLHALRNQYHWPREVYDTIERLNLPVDTTARGYSNSRRGISLGDENPDCRSSYRRL